MNERDLEGYELGDPKRIENQAHEPSRIREVRHGESAQLPPRMPAPMSKPELWHAVEVLSRTQGEAMRRKCAADVVETLDRARAMVLALYSMTPDEPHSVKVRAIL